MDTTSRSKPPNEQDLVSMLKHLLHLANDLCLAYGTAIPRIENRALRETFQKFDKSHDRYRVELAESIVALGSTAPCTGDLHGLVERGRVLLADLSGDSAIVQAMAVNEEELSSALRTAKHHVGLPPKLVDLLDRAIQHEHHHRRFYDDTLGRFVG